MVGWAGIGGVGVVHRLGAITWVSGGQNGLWGKEVFVARNEFQSPIYEVYSKK